MNNTVVYIDSYGDKRQGTEITCLHCKKTHITRSTKSKFCSSSCSSSYRSLANRINVTCAQCKKAFSKSKYKFKNSSKSELHFCSRLCKDTAQRIGGIEAIQPNHYNHGKHAYRDVFLRNGGQLTCSRCAYKEFSCAIDIHHIDENRTNNTAANLLALCSNCHRGLHNNEWNLN